jgi:hypothetical protein
MTTDIIDEIRKITRENISWYDHMRKLLAELNEKLRDVIILLRRPRLYELS